MRIRRRNIVNLPPKLPHFGMTLGILEIPIMNNSNIDSDKRNAKR